MAFIVFLLSALLSLVLVPPLVKLAHRYELIDNPDPRKVHVAPIPRIGGVAMVLAAMLSILAWLPMNDFVQSYLIGVAIIAVFGVWDDRSNLNYKIKFAGQFIATSLPVFFGDVVIRAIPLGPSEGLPDVIAYPLTIIFLVGITNAINLSDGLDGLAGGTSLLSLLVVALLAFLADGHDLFIVTLAVCGAIFGFLRYNTHPAAIFMGDTGSQFLGFSLGVLAIVLVQLVNQALSPVLLILLLGLPILDTASVMYQRIRVGRSPFSPDKNHLHHKLLSSGMHHYEAVTAIYILQALFVGIAVTMRYESDLFLLVAYICICAAIVIVVLKTKDVRKESGISVASKSFLPRFVLRVKKHRYFLEGPLILVTYAVPVYLIVGSGLIVRVPKDFGVLALLFSALLLVRLYFGYRAWFLFLRLMVFVAIGSVVYLLEMYPVINPNFLEAFDYIFFGVLALAVILSIRYHMADKFVVTPSDFLLIIALLFVGMIPIEMREVYHLVPVAVKLIVLFYSAELILKTMSSRWSLLPVTCLATMGVLAMRGLAI